MLTEERTQFIRGVIGEFADEYIVMLTNLDGEGDHIHILFGVELTTDSVKFINTVKLQLLDAFVTSTKMNSKLTCGATPFGTTRAILSRQDKSRWMY